MTPTPYLSASLIEGGANSDNWVLSDSACGGVAHPVNAFSSADELRQSFLAPLHHAVHGIRAHPLVAVQSSYGDQCWEVGTGYWSGTHVSPLFQIPPTGRPVFIRYTEMLRQHNGVVEEWYLIPDFLDVMIQSGVYPLRDSLGAAGRVLPPVTGDGLYPAGDVEGKETSKLVLEMLDELGRYDGHSLESMNLARFWDPSFLWYGPAGIGTTRGISGFREHHQGPFLRGFPDRVVDHHQATVAAGRYAGTGGWPHMHATHSGDGWLGLTATGKSLELRVMDIWRRDGEHLVENWVGIDVIHMLAQMGLDVFEQMQSMLDGKMASKPA